MMTLLRFFVFLCETLYPDESECVGATSPMLARECEVRDRVYGNTEIGEQTQRRKAASNTPCTLAGELFEHFHFSSASLFSVPEQSCHFSTLVSEANIPFSGISQAPSQIHLFKENLNGIDQSKIFQMHLVKRNSEEFVQSNVQWSCLKEKRSESDQLKQVNYKAKRKNNLLGVQQPDALESRSGSPHNNSKQ